MSGLMLGKKLTVEQRLKKAVIDIMANPKYVALSGILMVGKRKVIDGFPTAGTNGRDEVYGREFVEGLTDAELRFVILHENYHKMYKHLTTWQHLWRKDPQRANMACDFAINIKLVDDNKDGFATMPKDPTGKQLGFCDEKYRGWDTARVFHDLPECGGGGGGGGGQPGEGQPGEGQPGGGSGGLDQHDWEGAEKLSASEREQLGREIDQAIRQGALAAGKVGSGGDRDFDELLETKVRWQDVLRDFIVDQCAGNDYSTFSRPKRKYLGYGVYLPSGVSQQVGEVVVAPDMSGSIGPRELQRFMSEVKAICDMVHPSAVRLLYWDTKVCADEKYEGADVERIIDTTKPKGGGGTTVTCVPNYMGEHGIKPQVAIVLTDGYIWGDEWGEWSCPVLWCVVDNKGAQPPHKTVHIDTETDL